MEKRSNWEIEEIEADFRDGIFNLPDHWQILDLKDNPGCADPEIDLGSVARPSLETLKAPWWPINLAPNTQHRALAESLVNEAVSAREGVIPPSAFVECLIPPFIGVSISERRDDVVFAWHRPLVPAPTFTVRIKTSGMEVDPFYFVSIVGLAHLREELRLAKTLGLERPQIDGRGLELCSLYSLTEEALSAMYLMSAVILRDFWVVEDREDALRLGPPRRRVPIGSSGDNRERIIYLPRMRYSRERVERAVAGQFWETSPRAISSHFRNLPYGQSATERQMAIAQHHGIAEADIGPGRTWVRGYMPPEVNRIYRSRSAVRALTEIVEYTRDKNRLSGFTWYAFERLCERHLGAGRTKIDKVGDGGIDILAVDGQGGYVLVQAKYWSRPIDISVVTAMIGAREVFAKHRHVSGTRIVASSSFTENAKRLAADSGIELVTITG